MDELDRFRNRQFNEQLKAWAAVIGNLGVGLFGAEVAILWSNKGDESSLLYAFIGVLLMVASGGMMRLMVPEE